MDVIVRQAYYSHSIRFVRPAYGAFMNSLASSRAIFDSFQPYGVAPENIHFDGGQQPVDYQVSCSIRPFGVIRFRLSDVEVALSFDSPSPLEAGTLVKDALSVYRTLGEGVATRDQTVVLAAHGRLVNGEIAALLGRHVANIPEGSAGSPPLQVAGIVFATAFADVQRAEVDLAPSLVFPGPDTGFMKVTCDLRGDISPAEAFERTRAFAEDVLGRIELVPRWSA